MGPYSSETKLVVAWISALRIRQWPKNILVFLPMCLAQNLHHGEPYALAAMAFLSLCLTASAVYICNDLLDIEHDRSHPRKHTRPFAAGTLGAREGVIGAVILLGLGMGSAAMISWPFFAVLSTYLVLTTLYSFILKQTALVDVVTLATLYTLRIVAGSAATGTSTSSWLLAFALFFFLSLAFVKRYSECRDAGIDKCEDVNVRGRGYRPSDIEMLANFGAITGCLSVLVLALYINSDIVLNFYPNPLFLWLLCPLIFYWIARIWLLAHRGILHDDPLEFAVRDRATWLIGVLALLVMLATQI
jgi:4-hydroxybenzoate polyprenyltransferase